MSQTLETLEFLQGECGCRWREIDKDLRVDRYVCQHGEWTAEQSAQFAARLQALREASTGFDLGFALRYEADQPEKQECRAPGGSVDVE